MPTGAWIMLICGCLFVYGGLGFSLYIAMKKETRDR